MTVSRPKLLVLFARYTDTLSYYDDWQEAFAESNLFDTDTRDIMRPETAPELKRRIREYDSVVLLHSTNADSVAALQRVAGILAERRGRLLSFVGNEVNLPGCFIADKLAVLKKIGPDFVATQLPLAAGEYLYGDLSGSRVVEIPHALNPNRFKPLIPQADRPVDIGARSYKYLPALGDKERNAIIEFFQNPARVSGLTVDIQTSAQSRLTPAEWAAFLNRCKATVATEAGSYYLEKDDHTVRRIMAYVQTEKAEGLQSFYSRLRTGCLKRAVPAPIRKWIMRLVESSRIEQQHRELVSTRDERITFEDIHHRFFRGYANPISGKCISSRHFDAAGTKTVQIMFPGAFNGILRADEHYIALQRDFSNAADVLARLRDPDYRCKMTDRTYAYICAQHTYAHRIHRVYELLAA